MVAGAFFTYGLPERLQCRLLFMQYLSLMLVVLGGFVGGRALLARKLAEELHFYYCDINAYKMHTHDIGRDGHVRSKTQEPQGDEARLFLYRRVIGDFQLLAKMHTDVVVDSSFHRAGPREYFLREAEKYFKPVVFVWVEASEDDSLGFLRRMEKKGVIDVKEGLARREQAKENFQPFPEPPLTFVHSIADTDSVGRLSSLIREYTEMK
jgi:predicted kinase